MTARRAARFATLFYFGGAAGAGPGAGEGAVCGRAGAARVVTPGSVLARGAAGGAGGGADCEVCVVEEVPALFTLVLLSP